MSQELKNIATSINEISTEQHNLGTLLHKLMKQVEELMGEPFNLSKANAKATLDPDYCNMYDILDALGEFTIASNGVCTLDEAGHDSPRQADDVTSSPESQIEDLIQTYVIEPKMRALGLDV